MGRVVRHWNRLVEQLSLDVFRRRVDTANGQSFVMDLVVVVSGDGWT